MKKNSTTEVHQAIKVFRDYCAKKRMRYTSERESIIREIYRLGDHFNIDHLFERIRARRSQSRMAKTSIYRSVPHFLDAGLLRESLAKGQGTIYEKALGRSEHDHFNCLGCGKIVEFRSPELTQAQKKISQKNKFTVLWSMNVINGYCRECRQ